MIDVLKSEAALNPPSDKRKVGYSFFSVMVFLVVYGLLFDNRSLPFAVNNFLEAAFIFLAIIGFVNGGIVYTGVRFFALHVSVVLFFLYGFVYAREITGANVLDFMLAYKAYFYLMVLPVFVKKRFFDEVALKKLFRFLMMIFFARYSVERFIMGDDRPDLLWENNFELIFLLLLGYRVSLSENGIGYYDLLGLAVICALGGSRSAVLALMVVGFFMSYGRVSVRTLVSMFVMLPLLVGLVYWVFVTRTSAGVESVDRYKFLMEFLYSARNFGVWEYLFGTPPITPLDNISCSVLSYYRALYSYADENTCYSVILHSYILRALYDHGVVGFFFLNFVIFLYLRSSYDNKVALCVLLVLLVSGLSVSSYNSVFVALSLMVFLGSFSKSRIQ